MDLIKKKNPFYFELGSTTSPEESAEYDDLL